MIHLGDARIRDGVVQRLGSLQAESVRRPGQRRFPKDGSEMGRTVPAGALAQGRSDAARSGAGAGGRPPRAFDVDCAALVTCIERFCDPKQLLDGRSHSGPDLAVL